MADKEGNLEAVLKEAVDLVWLPSLSKFLFGSLHGRLLGKLKPAPFCSFSAPFLRLLFMNLSKKKDCCSWSTKVASFSKGFDNLHAALGVLVLWIPEL